MTHPTYTTGEPVLLGETAMIRVGAHEGRWGTVTRIDADGIYVAVADEFDDDVAIRSDILVSGHNPVARYWPPVALDMVALSRELADDICGLQSNYGTDAWPDLIGSKPEASVAAYELMQAVAPALLRHVEAGQ